MALKKYKNKAIVLILCIWLLIMVTIAVFALVRSSSGQLVQSRAVAGNVRARWAAFAGINYAIAAILADDNKIDSLADPIFNSPEFREHDLGDQLSFSIGTEGKSLAESIQTGISGVSDESARLNPYIFLRELATKPPIDNADPLYQLAVAIALRSGLSLEYDPLVSVPDIRKLIAAENMAFNEVYGEDANLNYMIDWNENDGLLSFPPDNADAKLQGGYLHNLTLFTFQENCDSQGERCVNINTATTSELAATGMLLPGNILWIIANRPFFSRAELFSPDITPEEFIEPVTENRREALKSAVEKVLKNAANVPQQVIVSQPPTTEAVRLLFDQITIDSASYLPGQVNINTVGPSVLSALTGLNRNTVDALLSYRDSLSGGFTCPADIFASGVITYAQLLDIVEKITLRSNFFSITSTGKCSKTNRCYQVNVVVSRYRFPGQSAPYQILRQSAFPFNAFNND
ncbi:MAG: general secretion pathway protein GspK [Sedimentisphaerales bacterium]|nr:general secretion pathway protein GspK [Sedimentisphaerales bacterium]MBN2841774.1 general secretion pathway protein GspK [Sedimentisphaerales bacterium]